MPAPKMMNAENEVEKRIVMMRELLKTMVDVRNLKQSKELRNSIEDEVKRQSVDAAKKRAAAQNVDYPCFANLVSCAHLKPMTRKELDRKIDRNPKHEGSIPAWSFDVTGHSQPGKPILATCRQTKSDTVLNRLASNQDLPSSIGSNLSCFENPLFRAHEQQRLAFHHVSESAVSALPCVPSTGLGWKGDGSRMPTVQKPGPKGSSYSSDLFIKEWKLLNSSQPSERLSYLINFPPSSLPKIFWVEIPPFLLAEILETLRSTALNLRKGTSTDDKSCAGLSLDSDDRPTHVHEHMSDCASTATRSHYKKHTTELRKNGSVSDPEEEIVHEQHHVLYPPPHNRVMDGKERVLSWVASVMEALTRCGRFGLAVKLVGQESRDSAREILEHITSATATDEPEMLTSGPRPSELVHKYSCI
ncbi:hypothetical protein MPTK2_8g08480 [Marchantia polymorpha subsp. ruderalis]